MITQLYTFSAGSYVVAEEWNANFRELYGTTLAHIEAIADAQGEIAFPEEDMSAIYSYIDSQPNSTAVSGLTIIPSVDNEYYKVVNASDTLNVNVREGELNGETRIIINSTSDRALTPINITYNGTTDNVVWENGIAQWYNAGMKFVFLLERNGRLYVKMIATGV